MSHHLVLRVGRSAASLMVAAAMATPARANTPPLSFYSQAQVYGYVNTQYSSPLLGNVSFTVNGPSDYKYSYGGSAGTGTASMNFSIPAGSGGTGDPVYDIVTSNGQYGFGYNGQAEVSGLSLHTRMSASTLDSSGQAVAYSPTSSVYAYSYGSWNQQFYIAPTAYRPAGSYGAILVGITLDGTFPALSNPSLYNSAWGQLSLQTNFSDTNGSSFQNSANLYANSGDPSWTGASTLYTKLLFQYGTAFSLQMWQYASASVNGNSDFFNTGRVSSIEIPYASTLLSGAQEAGVGTLSQLYGQVTTSATVDDINTNWDFGNGGGGFTPPPVPEPQGYAMLLAGLAVLAFVTRRQRPV